METIYVGYVPSDQKIGQALVTTLQKTGAHVWDDATLQHDSALKQASVFQACHHFILVLSRDALTTPQLRSQTLHFVTLHHWAPDYHVTVVAREKLATRDLWLFVRHFPRVEADDLTEAALMEQVIQTISATAPRKASTRLNTLVRQAGLVQQALATPSRFRRSWARTWRLQILAATTVLAFFLAILVSSTLLVKHTIIDKQAIFVSNTATPVNLPTATATVGLKPIFQATSTPKPRPSPTVPATKSAADTVTPTASTTVTPVATDVATPSPSLPVNNTGISNDGQSGQANYDAYGYSYSAQTLQTVGFVAGAPITVNGVTFTWPKPDANLGDNVTVQGQTVPLTTSPSATTLAFLGSSTVGMGSGTATLTYADGSTQTFTLEFSDWALGGGVNPLLPDNKIAATLPYRNTGQSGRDPLTVYVFYMEVALQPGKTLVNVVLPSSSGPGMLHVLAIGAK